jgi:antitoxin VapB
VVIAMITSVFMNNRTQAVRLPSIYRFSESTQKVFVRMIGVERVISPVEQAWDSFFDDAELQVSADFERGEQIPTERDIF